MSGDMKARAEMMYEDRLAKKAAMTLPERLSAALEWTKVVADFTRPADRTLPEEGSEHIATIEAALTALQSREAVVRELPPFDEVVREILGTPCFAVIQVAHVMRLKGFDIPRKAEEEQAAVAYFKLQMYMKYGKEWEAKGVAELNAMPKVEPK